jgi:hypothetical protein
MGLRIPGASRTVERLLKEVEDHALYVTSRATLLLIVPTDEADSPA